MNRSPTPFDRSLKALIRMAAPALLRLAGLSPREANITPEDTAINLTEFRADHVFPLEGVHARDRWAIYLEYQLTPDTRQLISWFLKTAGLTRQMKGPVILLVVYLRRGRRATFPDAYTVEREGLSNSFRFETIRLWEHADRIRSGEFPELAPLLVLCENRPTEATLREERQLILHLPVSAEVRADLLAVALTVAGRYFAREVVLTLFKEDLAMLKESDVLYDIVQEWVNEAEARVRSEEARRILLRILNDRFGEPPTAVVEQIQRADAPWCEEVILRSVQANSLSDLGF